MIALIITPMMVLVLALGFGTGRLYQALRQDLPRQEEEDELQAFYEGALEAMRAERDLLLSELADARAVARYWERYSDSIITGKQFPERPACLRGGP